MTEPTMQVAIIETHIGDQSTNRTATIRIALWHGESVARFTDLPPDMQTVLKAWVNA